MFDKPTVIATSKQPQEIFLHLNRSVCDRESWDILSPSFYTAIIVIQRSSAIFSKFYPLRRMKNLHMMLTSGKAKIIIQRIH